MAAQKNKGAIVMQTEMCQYWVAPRIGRGVPTNLHNEAVKVKRVVIYENASDVPSNLQDAAANDARHVPGGVRFEA